jgi:hydroxypyruvate reductase
LAEATIRRLFAAALAAVDPRAAVRGALAWNDRTLVVSDDPLPAARGVHLVAVGKAAVAMARGALDAVGAAIVAGDVITKEGHVGEPLPARIRVWEAGHPIPDARGVAATSATLDALAALEEGTVVLALISGGGSALLEAPRDGVSLDDLARTTDLLLRAGAPIEALNAVRAPLSRVKAGGLRRAAPRSRWVTLILSDVLGNDPRVIASGPTVPRTRATGAALAMLDRYGVRERVPPSVVAALSWGESNDETPQIAGDVLRIVGDNAAAVAAAAREAERLGLAAEVVWSAVEGEAAALGVAWVDEIARAPEGVDVLLGGGEATVTVRGDGRGGRNTEFALAAALELERRGMAEWAVASLATDGQDALTGMAGAVATAGTMRRAREAGVDPSAALAGNDSLTVFERAGGVVDTGPTGTNVNDIYVAVRLTGEGE